MHLFYPFVAILGYVYYPKFVFSPQTITIVSLFHNIALTLFSVFCAIEFGSAYVTYGIVFQHRYYFQHKEIQTLVWLFYLSKYYEFIDTFIIYAKGKTPIFLQTYHHIGAVVLWHLCYVYEVDAIVMASFFNSIIHSIMYAYYTSTVMHWRFMRIVKPFITMLQMTQFVVGNVVCIFCYQPPYETYWNYAIILLFVAYTSVLLILFYQFFTSADPLTTSASVKKL